MTTDFLQRLGIRHPVVQAPMAGGMTTPDLVVAVSEAGGLGSLAGAMLAPDALREQIRAIKARTGKPFLVNLFVLPEASVASDVLGDALERVTPWRRELGLPDGALPNKLAESFEAQFAVVAEEGVPVFSSTFDRLPADKLRRLKAAGTLVLGTATTPEEAVLLESDGVDGVVAQGAEAGGHRGTFLKPVEESLIGTMALVPLVADAVRVPVIAAGGIMDGRGVAAALALGAAAAAMGTAFLACPEAGTHPLHKAALPGHAAGTTLTRTVSGRHARGLRNRMLTELEPRAAEIPPYPVQNALTGPIRAAAAQQGNTELMVMWAGQGHRLATTTPAAALVAQVAADAARRLGRGGAD